MRTSENCRDFSLRRRDIRAHKNSEGAPDLNGIDYVEIDPKDATMKTIIVFFLGKAPDIQAANVRIEGGVRVRDLQAEDIKLCANPDPVEDDCLRVYVDRTGDFSTYTLRLVNAERGRPTTEPLTGFDSRYAQIEFSFKVSCPGDLDCLPVECAPTVRAEPEISYLAKDYASFRQLILDRLSLIMPDWRERHVPDIGIALVELLAYTGDHLSYYQDSVATESYLMTARQRISVRRHATLVDYRLHEGCNARAWVAVETDQDFSLDPAQLYFITGHNNALPFNTNLLTGDDVRGVSNALYEVFEPLLPKGQRRTERKLQLYAAHNRIRFYAWGNRECCLPRGATSATLRDENSSVTALVRQADAPPLMAGENSGQQSAEAAETRQSSPDAGRAQVAATSDEATKKDEHDERSQQSYYDEEEEHCEPPPPPPPPPVRALHLKVGDVLIFEEVSGPRTGEVADADMNHRHAVRLTRVEPDFDHLYNLPVVNIEWATEDALPFTLCINAIGRAPECRYLEDVSVARGNVILCDHGRSVRSGPLAVPAAEELDAKCLKEGESREPLLKARRFRPQLSLAPLTHSAPYPSAVTVSKHQATALGAIFQTLHARLRQLWQKTRRGERLSEAELKELTVIFGRKNLETVGLKLPDGRRRPQTSDDQRAALERLLAHDEQLLAKKLRRVEVLRRRTLAGYVLTRVESLELEEMFGVELVTELGLTDERAFGPATLALQQEPRECLPAVVVRRARDEQASPAPAENNRIAQNNFYPRWLPQPNLLASTTRDRHFVAEIDNDRRAHLRFGDGELGMPPSPSTTLRARYRVGNGRAGNVGAEAISIMVLRKTMIDGVRIRVRNLLPAQGGTEPELVDEAKLFAPGSFRHELERAITEDDYARLSERGRATSVQRAAAAFSWSGSWHEMRVAIDPAGTGEASAGLLEEIEGALYGYRRIGHDLAVLPAVYVPLDIRIIICVEPHYLRGHVKSALLDIYSNRALEGGRRGLFHPDNLTFGQSIYLSQLVAAAEGVEGVESVRIEKLERLFEGSRQEVQNGLLPLGPLEVARLDNDRNFPERGIMVLDVRGGR